MREIKFRAWDKDNKKMLFSSEGEYPYNADENYIKVVNDGILYANAPDMGHYGGGEWSYHGGEFEIMQYTGRKDKNGVEIYEDDIIIDEEGRYGLVYWNPEESHFLVDFQADMEIEEISYYYVVCGNSYENVALLK